MTRILITGGTGSFGTALTRRLVKDGHDRIVVFSRDEQKQHAMERELDDPSLRFFVGDVRDRDRLELAMRGIDYVFHAAAMKIIPTCERDPFECVHTNVLGAENVARAALRAGVQKVIALSTDKAAAPLNLYGATKLAAEKLFIAANTIAAGATTYSCVRYGNVVGSRGSVIPLFKQLAAEHKPLPITHRDMTRFWITIEQAVEFVLTSAGLMTGREIFVPKLPSMRIQALACAVNVAVRGEPGPILQWDEWYPIIGIRPGEKLHETLITHDEARMTFDLGDRYVIADRPELADSRVPADFAYTSDTNGWRLTPDELREMIA